MPKDIPKTDRVIQLPDTDKVEKKVTIKSAPTNKNDTTAQQTAKHFLGDEKDTVYERRRIAGKKMTLNDAGGNESPTSKGDSISVLLTGNNINVSNQKTKIAQKVGNISETDKSIKKSGVDAAKQAIQAMNAKRDAKTLDEQMKKAKESALEEQKKKAQENALKRSQLTPASLEITPPPITNRGGLKQPPAPQKSNINTSLLNKKQEDQDQDKAHQLAVEKEKQKLKQEIEKRARQYELAEAVLKQKENARKEILSLIPESFCEEVSLMDDGRCKISGIENESFMKAMQKELNLDDSDIETEIISTDKRVYYNLIINREINEIIPDTDAEKIQQRIRNRGELREDILKSTIKKDQRDRILQEIDDTSSDEIEALSSNIRRKIQEGILRVRMKRIIPKEFFINERIVTISHEDKRTTVPGLKDDFIAEMLSKMLGYSKHNFQENSLVIPYDLETVNTKLKELSKQDEIQEDTHANTRPVAEFKEIDERISSLLEGLYKAHKRAIKTSLPEDELREIDKMIVATCEISDLDEIDTQINKINRDIDEKIEADNKRKSAPPVIEVIEAADPSNISNINTVQVKIDLTKVNKKKSLDTQAVPPMQEIKDNVSTAETKNQQDEASELLNRQLMIKEQERAEAKRIEEESAKELDKAQKAEELQSYRNEVKDVYASLLSITPPDQIIILNEFEEKIENASSMKELSTVHSSLGDMTNDLKKAKEEAEKIRRAELDLQQENQIKEQEKREAIEREQAQALALKESIKQEEEMRKENELRQEKLKTEAENQRKIQERMKADELKKAADLAKEKNAREDEIKAQVAARKDDDKAKISLKPTPPQQQTPIVINKQRTIKHDPRKQTQDADRHKDAAESLRLQELEKAKYLALQNALKENESRGILLKQRELKERQEKEAELRKIEKLKQAKKDKDIADTKKRLLTEINKINDVDVKDQFEVAIKSAKELEGLEELHPQIIAIRNAEIADNLAVRAKLQNVEIPTVYPQQTLKKLFEKHPLAFQRLHAVLKDTFSAVIAQVLDPSSPNPRLIDEPAVNILLREIQNIKNDFEVNLQPDIEKLKELNKEISAFVTDSKNFLYQKIADTKTNIARLRDEMDHISQEEQVRNTSNIKLLEGEITRLETYLANIELGAFSSESAITNRNRHTRKIAWNSLRATSNRILSDLSEKFDNNQLTSVEYNERYSELNDSYNQFRLFDRSALELLYQSSSKADHEEKERMINKIYENQCSLYYYQGSSAEFQQEKLKSLLGDSYATYVIFNNEVLYVQKNPNLDDYFIERVVASPEALAALKGKLSAELHFKPRVQNKLHCVYKNIPYEKLNEINSTLWHSHDQFPFLGEPGSSALRMIDETIQSKGQIIDQSLYNKKFIMSTGRHVTVMDNFGGKRDMDKISLPIRSVKMYVLSANKLYHLDYSKGSCDEVPPSSNCAIPADACRTLLKNPPDNVTFKMRASYNTVAKVVGHKVDSDESAINFPLPKSNIPAGLEQFFLSTDGSLYQKAAQNIFEDMNTLIKRSWKGEAATIASLLTHFKMFTDSFLDKDSNGNYTDSALSMQMAPVYMEGIPALRRMIDFINANPHLLTKSKEILQGMIPGMHVCGAGVYINIAEAFMQLKDDSHALLSAEKSTILKAIAHENHAVVRNLINQDHHRDVGANYHLYDIHDVQAIINSDSVFGLSHEADYYALPKSQWQSGLKILNEMLLKRSQAVLTLDTLIDKLINRIDAANVLAITKGYNQATVDQLNAILKAYGDDPDTNDTTSQLFDENYSYKSEYEIEKYIKLTLMRRLEAGGYFTNTRQVSQLGDKLSLHYSPNHSLDLSYISEGEKDAKERHPLILELIKQFDEGKNDLLRLLTSNQHKHEAFTAVYKNLLNRDKLNSAAAIERLRKNDIFRQLITVKPITGSVSLIIPPDGDIANAYLAGTKLESIKLESIDSYLSHSFAAQGFELLNNLDYKQRVDLMPTMAAAFSRSMIALAKNLSNQPKVKQKNLFEQMTALANRFGHDKPLMLSDILVGHPKPVLKSDTELDSFFHRSFLERQQNAGYFVGAHEYKRSSDLLLVPGLSLKFAYFSDTNKSVLSTFLSHTTKDSLSKIGNVSFHLGTVMLKSHLKNDLSLAQRKELLTALIQSVVNESKKSESYFIFLSRSLLKVEDKLALLNRIYELFPVTDRPFILAELTRNKILQDLPPENAKSYITASLNTRHTLADYLVSLDEKDALFKILIADKDVLKDIAASDPKAFAKILGKMSEPARDKMIRSSFGLNLISSSLAGSRSNPLEILETFFGLVSKDKMSSFIKDFLKENRDNLRSLIKNRSDLDRVLKHIPDEKDKINLVKILTPGLSKLKIYSIEGFFEKLRRLSPDDKNALIFNHFSELKFHLKNNQQYIDILRHAKQSMFDSTFNSADFRREISGHFTASNITLFFDFMLEDFRKTNSHENYFSLIEPEKFRSFFKDENDVINYFELINSRLGNSLEIKEILQTEFLATIGNDKLKQILSLHGVDKLHSLLSKDLHENLVESIDMVYVRNINEIIDYLNKPGLDADQCQRRANKLLTCTDLTYFPDAKYLPYLFKSLDPQMRTSFANELGLEKLNTLTAIHFTNFDQYMQLAETLPQSLRNTFLLDNPAKLSIANADNLFTVLSKLDSANIAVFLENFGFANALHLSNFAAQYFDNIFSMIGDYAIANNLKNKLFASSEMIREPSLSPLWLKWVENDSQLVSLINTAESSGVSKAIFSPANILHKLGLLNKSDQNSVIYTLTIDRLSSYFSTDLDRGALLHVVDSSTLRAQLRDKWDAETMKRNTVTPASASKASEAGLFSHHKPLQAAPHSLNKLRPATKKTKPN